MTRKIACLDNIHRKGLALLNSAYELSDDPLISDAWLVRSRKLHDSELPNNLRAIARAGAGVNNIPLERCAEKGIVVFNTPGANANGVSELVIACMVLASRDIIGGTIWLDEHKFDEDITVAAESIKKNYSGTEIKGKVLGIIGLGAIGHLVANAAIGLGMNVLGYDPSIPVEYAWRLSRQVGYMAKLEDMLPRCDYLTIHVPLNDATEHLIDRKELQLLKKDAILLNFSRDALCNEDEVLKALETGKLRHYVCDFPNERNLLFPKTIVTPHLGAATLESEENCSVMAVEEVMNYLERGNIVNAVNYPDVSLGMLNAPTRVVVMHRNVPAAIQKMSALFGSSGYNIDQMVSNSRGAYATAIFDVAESLDENFVEKLEAYDDILKVRVIRKDAE